MMTVRRIFILSVIIGGLCLSCPVNRGILFNGCLAWSQTQTWQDLKGKHFIVYYTQDKSDAQRILHKAGNYYGNIARELGYPRYSDFWTWDNRVKIYIYPDHASYLAATGRPEWSHGMADYTKKEIIGYRSGEGFADTILPHEIAHLIFRDFVGFKSDIPLWLDEGVAQWAEYAKRAAVKRAVQEAYDAAYLIPLEEMMKMNISSIGKYENVHVRSSIGRGGKRSVLFLNSEGAIQTYYMQSVSLIGFMIERFGSLKFANFCRQLRDGYPLEEAIRRTYSPNMKDLNEMEANWIKYLEEGAR